MAFNVPDLPSLIARAQGDIESRLIGAYARPRRYLLNILATVQAALASDQHQHLNWLSRQVVPDQADNDILLEHCDFYGMKKKPAGAAKGALTLTGTSGSTLKAGSVWVRPDGVRYITQTVVTLAGDQNQIEVVAERGGIDTNTPAGVLLTLEQPSAGIDGQARVATGLKGGTDEESWEGLRGRLRQRRRYPPHGGAPHDYERWALEVAGVTRAWCLPLYGGEGTVGVLVANDDPADPSPDSVVLNNVKQWIEGHINPVTGQREGRPVGATVMVFAPKLKPLNPAIKLIPDSPQTRSAVQAELQALMVRSARPGGTLLLTDIQEAIKIAAGVDDYQLQSPVDNVSADKDQIHTVGQTQWR